MFQLAAVLILFCIIPIVSKGKIKLWMSIITVGIILGFIAGLKPISICQVFLGVFKKWSSLEPIIVVSLISIIGGLMTRYGLLNKVVGSLQKIITNPKIILMLIPAIMGILVIPGGAILSIPFVDQLGDDMGLTKPKKAVVNLAFRHPSLFVLPYSSSLLLTVSIFPRLNVYHLIGLNALFAIAMTVIAYFYFISGIKVEKTQKGDNILHEIIQVIIYISPVFLCVLLNIFFNVTFSIGLLLSVLLIFVLSDKKDFIKKVSQSFNYNLVFVFAGVLFLKDIILKMNDLLNIVKSQFSSANGVVGIIVVVSVSSLIFGLLAGSQQLTLGIVLPLVLSISPDYNLLLMLAFAGYISGFIGYYFSMLHVCQVFSIQYLNITVSEIYKEYGTFIAAMFALVAISICLAAVVLL